MTARAIEWQRLNAYVDGELSPDERAEVAARLAVRPDLAAQVATLTRVKAALAETAAAADVDRLRETARSPAWRAPWARIAAGVALLIGIGVGAATLTLRDDGRTTWLEQPLAAHEAWLADGGESFSEGGAGPLLAGLAGLGADASVPDLSAARLTITGVRLVDAAGRPALHVGYSGTRGCRLTLWITPASGDAAVGLTTHNLGSFRAYSWRAGDLAYALVSGMDPGRFAVIAETARKVTLERVQPAGETATALQRSRETSPPCKAA